MDDTPTTPVPDPVTPPRSADRSEVVAPLESASVPGPDAPGAPDGTGIAGTPPSDGVAGTPPLAGAALSEPLPTDAWAPVEPPTEVPAATGGGRRSVPRATVLAGLAVAVVAGLGAAGLISAAQGQSTEAAAIGAPEIRDPSTGEVGRGSGPGRGSGGFGGGHHGGGPDGGRDAPDEDQLRPGPAGAGVHGSDRPGGGRGHGAVGG